jgi:multiple sugar transport system substrate-binding protein
LIYIPDIIKYKLMGTKILLILATVSVIIIAGCAQQEQQQTQQQENETIKLIYAVHWMQNSQVDGIIENGVMKSKGLRPYIDEYTTLHPGIEIEIMQIPYGEYPGKIKALYDAGVAPDIYQVYSSWGVLLAREGALDKLPADIKQDVIENYISTAGVTINGEMYGIPTEINDYALVYNRALFRKAGINSPPTTWNELVADAIATTKKDSNGTIVQYGFGFLKGQDWGVVDQFLSLLYTNSGKFLSDDYSTCELNSTEGVESLDQILRLFKTGATDENSNIWDFGKGNVSMVIVAPWIVPLFEETYGANFDNDIGVAPMPYMNKPASLQYSWFMGVTSQSRHREEAWAFLKWLATDVQPSGTTRYGDLLTNTIGAIPSRNIDIATHRDALEGPLKKVYVEELKNSVSEPNVLEGDKVKNIIREEIETAWVGQKTAREALDSACARIDSHLALYYPA